MPYAYGFCPNCGVKYTNALRSRRLARAVAGVN
jgi:hypothetical protein